MKKGILFLLILFLSASFCYAQDRYVDSLRTHINPAIQAPETVDSITELADLLVRQGDMAEAREWLLLGYEVAEKINYREGLFKTLIEFGYLYLSREMPDSAAIMLDQAEIFAQTPEEKRILYNSLGTAHMQSGKLILAIDLYERVIVLSDSTGDSRSAAGAQLNLGNVYSRLGDHTNALRSFYNGLEFAESIKDSAFMATANNNVGLKFYDLENYDQAEYFLLRSEAISRDMGFTLNLRRSLINLANLHSAWGNYALAEQYFDEALELARETGDKTAEARVYYNLGVMESRLRNQGKAREYFNRSLEISTEHNLTEGRFFSAKGIGNLELDLGNIREAIRWFTTAIDAVDSEMFNSLRLDAYYDLYQAYKKAGNFGEALIWYELHNELRDQLTSSENSRLLAEYETRFNIIRQEQEAELMQARQQENEARLALQQWLIMLSLAIVGILLVFAISLFRSNIKRKEMNLELVETNDQLNEMNATVQNQNDELEQINQIKNKLFAIIAHDLRGPLSSLQSLLYLLKEQDLSKKQLDRISQNLEKNLQENANMMDNLLAWAQAQMNGISISYKEFALIDCSKAVTDPLKFQAEKKGIVMGTDIPPDLLIEADYDMIKLVLRNLVSNAVKFSKEGDTITVSAGKKEDLVEVRVSDEGVGIKEEDRDKIFSNEHFTSSGTRNEKGSGLGLILCKEFIEKHQGTIRFETIQGKGTTFIFTLPVTAPHSPTPQKTSG